MNAATKLVFLSALFVAQAAEEQSGAASPNPVRKVVTMLQNMQKSVEAEGKEQEDAYEKFMCWCGSSKGALSRSIAAAEEKIAALTSQLKAAKEKKAVTEEDLKTHQTARTDAKELMAKSTSIREREAAEYAKVKADLEENIAALTKAISAIAKGSAGAFLQTSAAQLIRNFAMERSSIPDISRQDLLAFLSGSESDGYAPKSGQISGILKQMQDEMEADLKTANKEEAQAIQEYEELMATKKKEVALLSEQIEVELNRIADLDIEIATGENDLEDTEEALAADQKFVRDTAKACDTKTAEWNEIKRLRTEELAALSETIKVLNDDDALELFKGTLPSASASFVQVEESARIMRAQARALVMAAKRAEGGSRPGLDLIALALSGKKIGFEKVLKMVDAMVLNLKKEQKADDTKKKYCDNQFDLSDDKKKELENSITDHNTAIEELTGSIEQTTEEIQALQAGIKELDTAVADATAERKRENADFKEMLSSHTAAKELLLWAQNRLNKFYNPKLYKAPAKRDLSEEDRIVVNEGGTLAPTMPSGIAGTGIEASFTQLSAMAAAARGSKAAPPPPPETFGAYAKQGEKSGVTAMITLLVAELDKETTEGQTTEDNSQKDYETMIAEAANKRAQDSKSITEKEAAVADAQEALEKETDSRAGAQKDLAATLQVIHNLHGECDWLLKYFTVRAEARAAEVESLVKAKAVLNGADFSLLQTTRDVKEHRRA